MEPYYADDLVTLYLGDCRDVPEWPAANVLVTDPPYGIGWNKGDWSASHNPAGHDGIDGDSDTSVRDAALELWGSKRPALVFGSLRAAYPAGWKRMLVFRKPTTGSGLFGNRMPWLTNWEPIFALGEWPDQTPGRDAVISTRAPSASGYSGYVTRYGHPHAKPVDVMETLIAARNQGRRAIGVELYEPYAERAALRLSQMTLVSL